MQLYEIQEASKRDLVAACCVALRAINQSHYFSLYDLAGYPSLNVSSNQALDLFEDLNCLLVQDLDGFLLQDDKCNRDRLIQFINSEESLVVQELLNELGISKDELFKK